MSTYVAARRLEIEELLSQLAESAIGSRAIDLDMHIIDQLVNQKLQSPLPPLPLQQASADGPSLTNVACHLGLKSTSHRQG